MSVTFIFTYVALSSAAFVLGRLIDQEQKILKLLSPSYKLGPEVDLQKEEKLISMLSPSFMSSLAELPKLDLGPEVWETLIKLSEKYPDKEVQVQIEFNNDAKSKKLSTGVARGAGSRKLKRTRPPMQFGAHPVPMMPVPISRGGLKIKDLFRLLGVKELKTLDGELITGDDEGGLSLNQTARTTSDPPAHGKGGAFSVYNMITNRKIMTHASLGPAPILNKPAPGAKPPAPGVTLPTDLAEEATRPVVMKDLWMHLGKCNGKNEGLAQHQQHMQEEGTNGLQGGTNVLQGGYNGLQGGTSGLQGGNNGFQGGNNGLQGGTNGLQGGNNGLQGGTNGLQGGTNGLKGGTNMEDEYDDDQAGAADEFIRMIREKVTVKRVSPHNQRTKWYKLMAGT